jgi:hypothetical protein
MDDDVYVNAHEYISEQRILLSHNHDFSGHLVQQIFGQKRFFMPNVQLVEMYFLPYCGNFFSLIKKLRNVRFYIRKKNYSPKIKKNHCYMHRFAVSKQQQQQQQQQQI